MARRLPVSQDQHDTAVGALAAHWAKPAQYTITSNPDGERNRWVGGSDCFPDLVAWSSGEGGDRAHWIVEVETADSVSDHEATQWADYAKSGVPFSLAVPSGSGAKVWTIANRFGISVNKVFEFSNEYSHIRVVEVSRPSRVAWR